MDLAKISLTQKIVFFVIALIVLIFFLIFTGVFPGLKGGGGGSTGTVLSGELQFWGIEKEEFFAKGIDSFEETYPDVDVSYRQLDEDRYEEELIDAFASGRGPDVLMIRNNWVPRHFEKLSSLPNSSFSTKKFRELFVDVVADNLIYQESVWGVPLFVDTLALYYNKDFLNTLGVVQPPSNWDDFQKYASRLTKKSITGQIERAGASIGTESNISEAADILAVLMIQSGARITNFEGQSDIDSEAGRRALSFYTSFANPASTSYSWNDNMPNSIEAFSRGQSAMIFAYSSAREKIEQLSAYLNYGVAPLPQLSIGGVNKNISSYWALAVSGRSQLQNTAWQFVFNFLNDDPIMGYLNESGKSPARRDLIGSVLENESLGVFAQQALSAKSWLDYNPTKTTKIFKEMIDSVNKGRFSVSQALGQASNEINELKREE